ncbi:MAG: hypothetical protein IJV05_00980 [Muribaculaceae bacterium]|nr:hypothetical protein [Muribaculaceae bacterium]
MNDFISTYLIPALVGASSGGGIFVLLSNKWVSNWFDKDLKKYQNKLDILKTKDEIKFNVLHHEMVTRISKLFCAISDEYKSIYEVYMAMFIQTPPEKRIKLLNIYYEKLRDLQSNLIENSIFLTSKVEDKFNDILTLFKTSVDELTSGSSQKSVIEMKESFEKEYINRIHSLRDEVKDIIGVDIKVDNE